MKCCYITVDGILCIRLVIGFIACRMLSHFMYFVRNDEIKMFNQSLLIGPLGTNFIEILSKILTFSLKKMCLNMSSGKCRPFCLDLNVLKYLRHELFILLHTQQVFFLFPKECLCSNHFPLTFCFTETRKFLWYQLCLHWRQLRLTIFGAACDGEWLVPWHISVSIVGLGIWCTI